MKLILMTRDGKTVISVPPSPALLDKDIIRHKEILYVYAGRLKNDYVFHEATQGVIP